MKIIKNFILQISLQIKILIKSGISPNLIITFTINRPQINQLKAETLSKVNLNSPTNHKKSLHYVTMIEDHFFRFLFLVTMTKTRIAYVTKSTNQKPHMIQFIVNDKFPNLQRHRARNPSKCRLISKVRKFIIEKIRSQTKKNFDKFLIR